MKKSCKNTNLTPGLDRDGTPDEENPEWTEEDFRTARRGLDGLASFLGEEAVAPLRKAGRPRLASPKRNGTFRLAAELWDAIRASGKGYHGRVETVLREALEQGRI